ncbi:DUF2269 family protein [Pseudactinotalea sp. HY160]|uniref:DUF2269 family protein n=1 Tax=Pseudactinotalea sp. HY160 TaxID=2654490 RepID=UPI00128CEBB9|nr:DUF2269 family protein [Pseudactinotalea sp. HY160]MPV50535.1 DUF2269 family protein [Pseudactinotalea sp. HY160]
MYSWLLFVHIIAAMVWVGGALTLSALATHVLREGSGVGRFIASLRVIGPAVFAPAPILVIGLGVWIVLLSDSVTFGQGWIAASFVLFGAAFLVGAVFQSRAAIAAQRAAEADRLEEAGRHLRRWSWGSRVIVALLAVATWVMVFKPGV